MRLRDDQGAALVVVIIAIAVLALGLGTYLQALGNYRRIDMQRTLDDRALMAAEAGLALESGSIESMSAAPSADTSVNFTLAAAQYAPFENVTVAVHVQTSGGLTYWTLTSTATCNTAETRGLPIARRVQVTLDQENFAKYEMFTNNFGGVWTPGYLQFLGLGAVYMGPIHFNSGVAFWPDFWSLSQVTVSTSGPTNIYSNYGDYVGAVYGNSAANNDVNILQYWDSTYPTAPYFGGGLDVMPTPVSLPSSMATDPRAAPLVNNAGLVLPDNYPSYNASAGPNFVVTLASPTSSVGSGQIIVKQYLGNSGGVPTYGPALNTTVTAVNGAMIVKGNIVALSGTLNGRLTIGAFAESTDPSGGNVNITSSLQYYSKVNNPSFQYPNPTSLVNADGSINNTYVSTIQGQLNNLTDMLGIVAEGNVMIPQYDLNGNAISPSASQPIYVDAVVMATGVSTSTPGGGGFGVQNELTRPPGSAYFLGGMIQNVALSWGLYGGSGITNGLAQTEFWDKRASTANGAPPFFPTTGYYAILANSWVTTYVANASTPTTYPKLPGS
jgi:Tfp pilus assembly protein PilX